MDLPLNSANETRAADPILTVEMLFQILKGFLRKSFSNGSGGVPGGVPVSVSAMMGFDPHAHMRAAGLASPAIPGGKP